MRIIAALYGLICYAVFFLSFLYLVGFLGNLFVPTSIDVGLTASTGEAFLVNLGLIALFGLQHSIMARPAFKAWWTRIVPKSVERSTYVLLTSLVLILLFWQWRPMTQIVWRAEAAWSVIGLWAVFAAGFLLVLLSTFVIDHFDLFGLRQVTMNLLRKEYSHPGFKVTFFYKFVRHPIYLGWLLAFWATPAMTLGHLLFAAGMTVYILIAVRHEERDLVAMLGKEYTRYQERVPMLLPRPDRIHETIKAKGPVTLQSPIR